MATIGFEFAYALDGSGGTPVIRALPVDGTGAYQVGDLCVVNADGQLALAADGLSEATAVIMQTRATGSDGEALEAAILAPNQVWRVSMDAASTLAVAGYTKTLDIADARTVDADDLLNGSLKLVATGADNAGNVLAYVQFTHTTFN